MNDKLQTIFLTNVEESTRIVPSVKFG